MQRVGCQTQRRRGPVGLGLVRELMTLLPVIRLFGLNPSQDAKCLAVGDFLPPFKSSDAPPSAIDPETRFDWAHGSRAEGN